ncbi:MAG: hypothetical protein ABSG25_02480 [Bryobacteraceae bacterium]
MTKILLPAFLIGVLTLLGAESPSSSEPHIVAQQDFRSEKEIEVRLVSSAPDGSIWLLVENEPYETHRSRRDFELWRLDSDSKRTVDLRLEDFTPNWFDEAYAMAAERDGSVAITFRSENRNLTLLVIGKDGRVLIRKILDSDHPGDQIMSLRVASDSFLTAVRYSDGKPSLVKIRPDGETLFKQTLNDSETGGLLDALRTETGELVATTRVMQGKKLQLAVEKIVPDGTVRAKVTLPDAFTLVPPALCLDRHDHGFAVVYETIDIPNKGWNVTVEWFDQSLSPKGKASFFHNGIVPTRVAALPDERGNVLIGTIDGMARMKLVWLAPTGRVAKTMDVPAAKSTTSPYAAYDFNKYLVEQPQGFAAIVRSKIVTQDTNGKTAGTWAIRVMKVQ